VSEEAEEMAKDGFDDVGDKVFREVEACKGEPTSDAIEWDKRCVR
jgi:hypothetical protein